MKMNTWFKKQFGDDYLRLMLKGIFLGLCIVVILLAIDIQFGTHILW